MSKIYLRPCPYCNKDAVFIGVHDDEGNYHGRLGCDYELDPWSGLSYALHHIGWGECILCTDDAETELGEVLFDTAEEAAEAWNSVSYGKKAEWQHIGGDEWCCTACGSVVHTEGSWENPTDHYCSECGAEMRQCRNCKNFLGMGDWNLCCSKKPDLCYENTPACKLYTPTEIRKVPRITTLTDLFAHLITYNSTRPFNDIWNLYFKNLKTDKGTPIGKLCYDDVKEWLEELIAKETENDN